MLDTDPLAPWTPIPIVKFRSNDAPDISRSQKVVEARAILIVPAIIHAIHRLEGACDGGNGE